MAMTEGTDPMRKRMAQPEPEEVCPEMTRQAAAIAELENKPCSSEQANKRIKRLRENEDSQESMVELVELAEQLTFVENGSVASTSKPKSNTFSQSNSVKITSSRSTQVDQNTWAHQMPSVDTTFTLTLTASDEKFSKKVEKLAKDPFGHDSKEFMRRTLRTLRHPNEEVLEKDGFNTATVQLSAVGKIYVAQVRNYGTGVYKTAHFINSSPNDQEHNAPNTDEVNDSRRNGSQLGLNTRSEDTTEEIISEFANDVDENRDNEVSSQSSSTVSAVTEGGTSENSDNNYADDAELNEELEESTFETRNQDQLNKELESNHDIADDSEDSAQDQDETLRIVNEADTNSMCTLSGDPSEDPTHEMPLRTSTPKSVRFGAAAGTRDIDRNSRFQEITGSPLGRFAKNERTSGNPVRRQLFGDTLNTLLPKFEFDAGHVDPVNIGDDNSAPHPRPNTEDRKEEPQGDNQAANRAKAIILFDCMQRLLLGENQNAVDLTVANNACSRIISPNCIDHLNDDAHDAEENIVDKVDWSSSIDAPMPPSQLFRPSCDPNDNTGLTIMEQSKEKGRKDSRKIRYEIYLERVDPNLQKFYMLKDRFEYSTKTLKPIATFYLKMQNVLQDAKQPLNVPEYEIRILNAANSLKSKDTESELSHASQESGYMSQETQQAVQPANSEWMQFDTLVSETASTLTHQEIARSFAATMFLLGSKGLEASFGPPPPTEAHASEKSGFEPASSSSLSINQTETDINNIYFKALTTVSRTEDFRQREINLASSVTRGSGNAYSPEEEEESDCEVFEVVTPVFRGELFSKRSRQIQAKKRAKVAELQSKF